MKKPKMVDVRLTDEQLDLELHKVKFRSKSDKEIFNEIKEKSWFRSYARNSKTQLKKITAKVKKGIRHGQFTYHGAKVEEPVRGTTLPQKVKKTKQKIKEQEKKVKIVKERKAVKKNPVKITKREYTKEVKGYATEFKMPDI